MAAVPAPAVADNNAADKPKGIFISLAAIERARDLAPGMDVYWLENIYREWAAGKEPARNVDARFLAWIPSFLKKQSG